MSDSAFDVSSSVTYHDLVAKNKRNSTLLIISFILFIGLLVAVLGGVFGGGDPALLGAAATVGIVGASGLSLWSYYGGSRVILRMSGAREVPRQVDPELYNVVEEMAIAAGIPPPPVFVIDDTALNAFATGRDPEHSAVAITSGLRERLTRDELQAVMAHEVSHVRHFDIRLAMLLATLVGIVLLLSDFFWRGMRWRMWSRGRRGSDRGGGAIQLALLAIAVLLAAVAPLIAKVIQLAASRQREYLADAGAVELTRYPEALISALRKLGADKEVLENANRATAHLFIVQPIKKWEARAKGLLSTHPPIEARIARLERLLR